MRALQNCACVVRIISCNSMPFRLLLCWRISSLLVVIARKSPLFIIIAGTRQPQVERAEAPALSPTFLELVWSILDIVTLNNFPYHSWSKL